MPEKGKRDKDVVRMYMQHDFIAAYSMHTDSRVGVNGYRSAVGSVDDWERHGDIQSQFLLDKGICPGDRLLDIGCGTGRLARKIVPHLGDGGYAGVDISPKAVAFAKKLSVEEGWADRKPTFLLGLDHEDLVGEFDYLWSFSVFVHLPCEIMRDVMSRAAGLMHERSQFFYSFVPEKVEARTGPKSFRHTLECYQSAAEQAGLTFERDMSWPAEQKLARSMLS